MTNRPLVTRTDIDWENAGRITRSELLGFHAWELAQLLDDAVGTNASAAAIIADPSSGGPLLEAAKRNFASSLKSYEKLFTALGAKIGMLDAVR